MLDPNCYPNHKIEYKFLRSTALNYHYLHMQQASCSLSMFDVAKCFQLDPTCGLLSASSIITLAIARTYTSRIRYPQYPNPVKVHLAPLVGSFLHTAL